jgi:hypothetical protein
MADSNVPKGGAGGFSELISPLNSQVPKEDPRSGIAKVGKFPVPEPKDPLNFIP